MTEHKRQLGLAALGAAAIAGAGFMLASRSGNSGRTKRGEKKATERS
jgi:hypothetical protein